MPASFNIEIVKAKKIKPNLRTLLIGNVSIWRASIKLFLREIWIYDVVTGEIFLRQKVDLNKISEEAQKKSEGAKKQEQDKSEQEREKYKRQVEKAKTLYENRDDDGALIELRRILVSEPMNAEAYLLLGKIHFRRGDAEQAISSLKTAVFWDNRLIDAHLILGKIYLKKGDCLQAKNYLVSAMAIDSENQDAIDLDKQVVKCYTQ